MPNAQDKFILLWKRAVAALSLVAAALLASMAAAPVGGGAGAVGSRAGLAGPSAALASVPSALIASLDGIVEDGQHAFPPEDTGGARAKALVPAPWRALLSSRPPVVAPSLRAGEPPRHHAARSGLTRAPPRA
jgi:hypothetical protein